jgi:hypothetical protein
MLTQLRRPVRLTFGSTDLGITSEIETVGTLYRKEGDRYHLVFTEPLVKDLITEADSLFPCPDSFSIPAIPTPRLLWLEFSPYRVSLTMQGNGQFSYRHLFEPGVYGVSRYWFQEGSLHRGDQFRLRNFTRNLHVKGNPLPMFLLLEYELWSSQVNLGQYTLSLEIHH